MLTKLAAKLQQARKTAGLNQIQVADSLGIGRNKIINLEKGEGNVDVTLLGRLARLYGYSLSYFLDDEIVDEEPVTFAFRAVEIAPEDAYLPAWGRQILLNVRTLEEICEGAGI